MDVITVALSLVGLVAVSTTIGLVWRARQGWVTHRGADTIVKAQDVPGVERFAAGATLVQFSTEVCAPCRATHSVLKETAADYTDVTHVNVDLTHRPDIAKRFRVMQTPTTLILDSKGRVRARIGGAPRPGSVRAEIDRILAIRPYP